MQMRSRLLLFGIAILAGIGVGWFLFVGLTGFEVTRTYEPWMGIKPSGNGVTHVGNYRSLDTCRRERREDWRLVW
jgi:hypothetical protein